MSGAMAAPRTPAARAAVGAFTAAGVPRGDRFHVAVRWRTCPFAAVEKAVPREGRVLEVGCGHGLLSLYLALTAPHRQVTGVDIDAAKVALAQRAAAAAGVPATFSATSGELPDGPFDAIVIADVLYLLPLTDRLALLDACVDRLAPGGRLVVKEAGDRPRWKWAPTVVQELLATRVLRITEGAAVEFASPATLADHLRGRGLAVTVRRIDRGYPHPHVLIEGVRP